MPRKATRPICEGCRTWLDAPGVTPSTKKAGYCTDCAPDKVTHLVLAGDFDTFCGTSMRIVNDDNDADATVYDALFGSNHTNCLNCARVLRDRNKRR
ncbi:hypothetical protein ACGFIW_01450 [Micromonospora sp. NPDC048935]|uniref:hypothetical protein n=1 Tax=Micromonospora sp. NPDC048935 TaxID=3364262 RepID=UPI00371F5FA2